MLPMQHIIDHTVNALTTILPPKHSIPASISYSVGKTTLQNGTLRDVFSRLLYAVGISPNLFNEDPSLIRDDKLNKR